MKKDYIIINEHPLVPQMLDEEHMKWIIVRFFMRMYWGKLDRIILKRHLFFITSIICSDVKPE